MKHFYNSAATVVAVHQFHTQDDMFLVNFKQILLSCISWLKISTKIMPKMEIYTHYSRQQTIGVRHCQSQDGMYKLNFLAHFVCLAYSGQIFSGEAVTKMKHFYILATKALDVQHFQCQDGMPVLYFKQILLSSPLPTKIFNEHITESEIFTHFSWQEIIVVHHHQRRGGVLEANFWQILTVRLATIKICQKFASR